MACVARPRAVRVACVACVVPCCPPVPRATLMSSGGCALPRPTWCAPRRPRFACPTEFTSNGEQLAVESVRNMFKVNNDNCGPLVGASWPTPSPKQRSGPWATVLQQMRHLANPKTPRHLRASRPTAPAGRPCVCPAQPHPSHSPTAHNRPPPAYPPSVSRQPTHRQVGRKHTARRALAPCPPPAAARRAPLAVCTPLRCHCLARRPRIHRLDGKGCWRVSACSVMCGCGCPSCSAEQGWRIACRATGGSRRRRREAAATPHRGVEFASSGGLNRRHERRDARQRRGESLLVARKVAQRHCGGETVRMLKLRHPRVRAQTSRADLPHATWHVPPNHDHPSRRSERCKRMRPVSGQTGWLELLRRSARVLGNPVARIFKLGRSSEASLILDGFPNMASGTPSQGG